MAKPKTLPYDAAEEPGPFSVELHNTTGGSDKIYRLSIEPAGEMWMVNYANGPRTGTIKSAPKTTVPVGYAEARKICNAQLYDKVGGGYVPIGGSRFGDGMTAEAIQVIAKAASGHIPQLLRPIGDAEVEAYVQDPRYVAQPKHNGERRLLIVDGGAVVGGNRRGETASVGNRLLAKLGDLPDVVLDGEQIGDVVHYWDILSYKGRDLRGLPLKDRLALLGAGDFARAGALVQTETARTPQEKRALIDRVRSANGEGVVFKRLDAAYEAGKAGPASAWVKLKFWKSLSAVVSRVNRQRSVGIDVLSDSGEAIPVGNVTIPVNQAVPDVGSVIEVGYLFANDGGSLEQPSYLGPRSDIVPAECLASQRVFKDAVEPDADEPSGPTP